MICPEMQPSTIDPKPFSELRSSGLLWLINRVVFHPRGFALSLVGPREGEPTGWSLEGDGSEVWTFDPSIGEDEALAKVRELLGP